MKFDVVIAGVGGQGVLTASAVLAGAAALSGLHVKQSEVHGMAQRGGSVLSFVRIADAPIASDIIGTATADAVVGLEPLEASRALIFLREDGSLVSSINPTRNIPDYPEIEQITEGLTRVPGAVVLDASAYARQSGSVRTASVVMVGAISSSIPIPPEWFHRAMEELFESRKAGVMEANLKAFAAGRASVASVGSSFAGAAV